MRQMKERIARAEGRRGAAGVQEWPGYHAPPPDRPSTEVRRPPRPRAPGAPRRSPGWGAPWGSRPDKGARARRRPQAQAAGQGPPHPERAACGAAGPESPPCCLLSPHARPQGPRLRFLLPAGPQVGVRNSRMPPDSPEAAWKERRRRQGTLEGRKRWDAHSLSLKSSRSHGRDYMNTLKHNTKHCTVKIWGSSMYRAC